MSFFFRLFYFFFIPQVVGKENNTLIFEVQNTKITSSNNVQQQNSLYVCIAGDGDKQATFLYYLNETFRYVTYNTFSEQNEKKATTEFSIFKTFYKYNFIFFSFFRLFAATFQVICSHHLTYLRRNWCVHNAKIYCKLPDDYWAKLVRILYGISS